MASVELLDYIRLSDLPELAQQCASFHAKLNDDDSADGYDMRLAAFRKLALDGEKEDAVVAFVSEGADAGQIAGLAALVQTDLEAFDDLGPWVSGIAVLEAYEQTNLVLMLVQKIEEVATDFGFDELYLSTQVPETFRAHGYQNIEPFNKNGSEHWVLGKAL